MVKIIQNISIVLIAFAAICNASPARLERLRPSKSKFLARQEVAEEIPSQTPYPPAGIKPEIRFDLPTDEKLIAPENTYLPPVGSPAQAYGPPAKTYGPPEVNVKDEVEEVSNDEPKEQSQPEEPQSEEPKPEETQPEEPKAEQPKVEEPQPEEVSSEQPEEAEAPQLSDDEQEEDNNVENDAGTEAEEIEAEIERVEAEEGLINPFLERILLPRSNGKKGAKLSSAKLQVAQPIYLVNYNGQLYRLLK